MPSSLPNKLCLWRDGMLYLGDSFDPQMHRHHAVQCCIALDGELHVSWELVQGWQPCQAAVIGANVPHRIANPDGSLCLLYLEKTSASYRSIVDYHCVTPGCNIRREPLLLKASMPQSLRKALRTAMSTELEPPAANKLKQACMAFFHGQLADPHPLDPRIGQLLTHIHQRPGEVFTGEALADVASLSESRMQHLFKQQIGIPIRRYLLWARLRQVLELALTGNSLTTASHEAGFSDSAHFSRTFKAMFGIAPSLLLAPGSGLVALLCERERYSLPVDNS